MINPLKDIRVNLINVEFPQNRIRNLYYKI